VSVQGEKPQGGTNVSAWPWHNKIHTTSYADRLRKAEARLKIALKEVELMIECADEQELDELEADPEYRELAAELRANA